MAYVWGAGDGGQLGTGTQEHSLKPIKFPVSAEVCVGSSLYTQYTLYLNLYSIMFSLFH